MTDQLLTVTDLEVAIDGQSILTDVSLRVAPGEILGIVGESGSGKTITSRVLTGMLGPIGARVTGGRVSFAGRDLTALDERSWRQIRGHKISLVPQGSQSALDPLMSIGKQMVETVEALSGAEDAEARSRELLESVRLDPTERLLRAHPNELSGGMRQRVMIALALAGNAELLIGDEATTALDVTVQREILELLGRLRHERGLALILITHDLGVVRGLADSVSVMYAGATVETGSTAEVLRRPRHPYTAALLGAQPGGVTKDRPLTSIAGSPPAPSAWPSGCRFAPRCRHSLRLCTEAQPPLRSYAAGHDTACARAEELERL
ncbi:MAG: ABC transporter ATP-binding protein [Actinobacteria bacterium]|nr:ABC transporter ATP-binding protein [Actinomycetota bacterium]